MKQFDEEFKMLLLAENLLELRNEDGFAEPVSNTKLGPDEN